MTSDDGTARGGTPLPAQGAIEGAVVGGTLPTDPRALEAFIAERRSHLAGTVDELVGRAQPKEIARRSVADARSRVRAFAVTPAGEPRVERLAAVAGAAVTLLVTLLLVRRRLTRDDG